ncbi:glycosyltransferase family 87 protein [Mesorhizobium sp. 1M-11]|uniref:glycosyltransferase family 87 protein n=1 Tax=Mesorhizobium sp. 1M-11 TaxID=1529006 RepID=UPI0006C75104|nr:glycosyltransferase family 87 protein [Mesorhizobium sp. 1M-11]
MGKTGRNLKLSLLALGLAHLVGFLAYKSSELSGINGLLNADGRPVGDDFINLWTVARMELSGQAGKIYSIADFEAYQATLVGGAELGLRLWAYPPHSLLLVWPFGLIGYYPALAIWSALGLILLFIGARRFGFNRLETAVLLTSPATVLNLYYGQSGSLVTGLVLLALSARTSRDAIPTIAATVLTIKPQGGFLLPLLWGVERRWWMILWTAFLTVLFLGSSIAIFGIETWRTYLGDTLPKLSELERNGTGPFMAMIPSVFMAMRIVTGQSDIAIAAHAVFAIAIGIAFVWRLWRVSDPERRAALLLLATVLITPYIHNYDLALLLCGALLVARRPWVAGSGPFKAELPIIFAWMIPQLVLFLNMAGVPISPLLILPLLFLA